MLIFSHVRRVLLLKDVFHHVGFVDRFIITPITAVLNLLKAGVDIIGPYAFARGVSIVAEDEPDYEIFGMKLNVKQLLYITAACYAYSRFAPHLVRSTVIGTRKRMVRNMMRSILDKTNSISYTTYLENKNLVEQSVQYVGDVSELVSLIPSNIHQPIFIYVAGTTVVYLSTGVRIGSIFLSFVVLNVIIGFGLYELFGAAKIFRIGNNKFLEFVTRYNEDLSNFDVIRAFNKGKLESAIVDGLDEAYLDPYEKGVWRESSSSVFTNVLPMFADFGLVTYMVESGNLTVEIGELVFLLGLLGIINFNNSRFVDSCYRSFRLTTNYDEVKKVLNLPNEDHSLAQTNNIWLHSTLENGPTIKFENVSFKYDSKDQGYVLRNINFDIPANEHWAIIGNSGSGKSTIVKLLLRLYKPTEGVIKINDRDINTIPEKDLRKVVGLLSQEVHLFENDTIEFNVAYGFNDQDQFLMAIKQNPNNYSVNNIKLVDDHGKKDGFINNGEFANDESEEHESLIKNDQLKKNNSSNLVQASLKKIAKDSPDIKPEEEDNLRTIKKMLVHSSIKNENNNKLPIKAKELSTGQKQRVGLARLLLRNSSIFVLDEPTAAIDSEIEAEVIKSINSNSSNKTTVMVAHRLNTVVNSNKIIVLNKGEIDQIGTHSELLKKCRKYKRLWRIQQGVDPEKGLDLKDEVDPIVNLKQFK